MTHNMTSIAAAQAANTSLLRQHHGGRDKSAVTENTNMVRGAMSME